MSFKIREAHWEVLIDFMEKNPDFARGRFMGPQGKETARKLWAHVTQMLNSMGFGEKSAEKWQKTWTDFKYNIKKKGSLHEVERKKTGGGQSESEPFNKFELRVLSLLGGQSFYAGVGIAETGQSNLNISDSPFIPNSTKPNSTKPQSTKPMTNTSTNNNMDDGLTENINLEIIDVPFLSTININPTTPTVMDNQEPTCSLYLKDHTKSNLRNNAPHINTKRNFPSSSDHAYSFTPKKKKKDTMDDAYGETIEILKNINQNLMDLKTIIKEGLTDIAVAINNRNII